MRETDRQIEELYTQFKSATSQPEQKKRRPLPIIGGIAQVLKKGGINNIEDERRAASERIEYQICNLLRDRAGVHPLARLSFVSSMTGPGFDYGFDYNLGDDVFAVDYWAYNDWGILVQKHPSDFAPKIEIVKKTEEPTEEELKEDPKASPYTTIDRLLHLPEGFKIPVGPLNFESDSLPKSEEEIAAEKARAIEIAKALGIKTNKNTPKLTDIFPELTRKYRDRYFYWQPILPDDPTEIAIDFDDIEPYHMGLTLENAPTFSNTLAITDRDL